MEEFKEFEEKFNLDLPQLYKDIIIENNGGVPERSYFKGNLVGFESITYGKYPLEEVIEDLEEHLPKGAFPFASYCGQSLCISLNEKDYGTIYFLDETGEYRKVCDSFEQFMEELSEDDDY